MITLKNKTDDRLFIIYPAALSSHEFEQAEIIFNRIWALTGVHPVLTRDDNISDDVPAILVGKTNFPESRKVLNNMNYGEGEIRVVGNRLVITSWIDSLLPQLVSYVTDSMAVDENGKLTAQLTSRKIKDTCYLNLLTCFDGGKLIAYRGCGDQCDMVVISDTNEEMFLRYLDKLEVSGFKLEWKRKISGNIFACFKNAKAAIHVYYTPFNNFTRILIEPVSNLYVQSDQNFTRLLETKLTFMGRRFSNTSRYLDKDSGAGQMSYVLQLSDGSFIVIDGGLATDAFADGIWDAMCAQAPDRNNITIASWIITHSHCDHIGGFVKFAGKYAEHVKLERVIFNFPAPQDAEAFREAWNIRITKETLYNYYPDAVFSKVHTGDKLRIRDAEIEVLYTHEDFIIQYISLLNTKIYNEASLVMKVTLADSVIMFMADAQDGANNIICSMYGNQLKSDILQVCHHGGVGGTIPLYEAIDPEVAIFSTSDELLPIYLGIRYNYHLVYEQNVKQIFNSAEKTITLPLPYKAEYNNIPPFNGTIVEKVR